MSFKTEIQVSDDNITFTALVQGESLFAASVRYAKITITLTAATNKGLAEIFNIRCLLNVREATDQGTVDALASDAAGTVVTYNATFRSVRSVVATTETTAVRFVVVTAINTTNFKVLVFNDSGVRQNETVNWIARGKI